MFLSRVLSSYVFRFTFWYATGLSIAVFILLAIVYAAYSYNIYAAISDSLRTELQAFNLETAVEREKDVHLLIYIKSLMCMGDLKNSWSPYW